MVDVVVVPPRVLRWRWLRGRRRQVLRVHDADAAVQLRENVVRRRGRRQRRPRARRRHTEQRLGVAHELVDVAFAWGRGD